MNTLKLTTAIAATSAIALAAPAFAGDYQTGLIDLAVNDAQTDRPLEGFVWYPTGETEGGEIMHTNAVWQGIDAIKGAHPSAGKHPLVILSHGMFGNSMNQTWLADELASRGYIVAAISHPGTSTWERDPDHRRELWERPRDISRVIDHLTSDGDWETRIDQNSIFMAGHSLGGFTAMLLAGAQYNADQIDTFCAATPGEMVCDIFQGWNIAKTPEDRIAMSADLSDDRIKGFGVFDLGGTQSFDAQSLASISKPLLVFGAPITNSGLDLNIESRALVAALPDQNVTYIEPSDLSHFDFLGMCKDGAIEILKAEGEGDEMICNDGQAARQADHAMIANEFVALMNSN